MKRILTILSILIPFFVSSFTFANPTGPLFKITSSGQSIQASATLCLNARGPLSCQDYNLSGLLLSILTTITNHTYPYAGIKINTAGYSIANLGIDCTPIPNGYCLFSVNGTTPKNIILIQTGSLTLSPATLPTANLDNTYNATITAVGGVGPYTFSVTSGSLPPGLSLNSNTGVITGTPTSTGTFPFTITATDTHSSRIGMQDYSIVVSLLFTEYSIPTPNSGPIDITSGPDGNLWFTEHTGNKVTKLTTSGNFTEYTIPTAASFPIGITQGPDLNLWFTENTANKISNITTLGVITEYSIPSASSAPTYITSGPDGNLWCTQPGARYIGRITTSGTITEFSSTGIRPTGITQGPDGNLWYTDFFTSTISKIPTVGSPRTAYPTPTINSAPNIITQGPDGNLWFTESNANKIGRITTSGVITEFDIPTPNSQPFGITLGPDNKIWFTEFVGNKIAKIG